jgi:hypothetical protein
MIFFFRKGIKFLIEKYFLLQNFSIPPTDIPIEELQRDEAIDCQVCLILTRGFL